MNRKAAVVIAVILIAYIGLAVHANQQANSDTAVVRGKLQKVLIIGMRQWEVSRASKSVGYGMNFQEDEGFYYVYEKQKFVLFPPGLAGPNIHCRFKNGVLINWWVETDIENVIDALLS